MESKSMKNPVYIRFSHTLSYWNFCFIEKKKSVSITFLTKLDSYGQLMHKSNLIYSFSLWFNHRLKHYVLFDLQRKNTNKNDKMIRTGLFFYSSLYFFFCNTLGYFTTLVFKFPGFIKCTTLKHKLNILFEGLLTNTNIDPGI